MLPDLAKRDAAGDGGGASCGPSSGPWSPSSMPARQHVLGRVCQACKPDTCLCLVPGDMLKAWQHAVLLLAVEPADTQDQRPRVQPLHPSLYLWLPSGTWCRVLASRQPAVQQAAPAAFMHPTGSRTTLPCQRPGDQPWHWQLEKQKSSKCAVPSCHAVQILAPMGSSCCSSQHRAHPQQQVATPCSKSGWQAQAVQLGCWEPSIHSSISAHQLESSLIPTTSTGLPGGLLEEQDHTLSWDSIQWLTWLMYSKGDLIACMHGHPEHRLVCHGVNMHGLTAARCIAAPDGSGTASSRTAARSPKPGRHSRAAACSRRPYATATPVHKTALLRSMDWDPEATASANKGDRCPSQAASPAGQQITPGQGARRGLAQLCASCAG